jgi:hypothetical protein
VHLFLPLSYISRLGAQDPANALKFFKCPVDKTIPIGFWQMISFSSSQRFFLYRGATDMRRSFAGLGYIVGWYMKACWRKTQ